MKNVIIYVLLLNIVFLLSCNNKPTSDINNYFILTGDGFDSTKFELNILDKQQNMTAQYIPGKNLTKLYLFGKANDSLVQISIYISGSDTGSYVWNKHRNTASIQIGNHIYDAKYGQTKILEYNKTEGILKCKLIGKMNRDVNPIISTSTFINEGIFTFNILPDLIHLHTSNP